MLYLYEIHLNSSSGHHVKKTPVGIIQQSRKSLLRAEFSLAGNVTVDKNNSYETDPHEEFQQEATKNYNAFTKEFMNNRIEVSLFQKFLLSAGSFIAAIVDPHRHDLIAWLGETTGTDALQYMLESMKATEEGQRILMDKPRINTKTVDMNYLRLKPTDGSFHTHSSSSIKFLICIIIFFISCALLRFLLRI